MRPIHTLSLLCLCCLLSSCAQLQQTGAALRDQNGVLLDGDTQYLGQRRYRIELKGSSLLFDGDAEPFFRRRAEEVSRTLGCKRWQLLEYKGGVENTLLGARRYAHGVIECQ